MIFQLVLLSVFSEILFAEITQDKRLVLHSGDDIATEFLNLRKEIEALKTKHDLDIQALKTNHSLETQALYLKIEQLQKANRSINCDDGKRLVLHSDYDIAAEFQALRQEIQTLKTEIDELKKDQGSTYVRWGRTTCDGNMTEKVYSGFTSGSPHDLTGGAASYICLPEHPAWAKYVEGIQDIGGYVSGTEFEISVNIFSPFPHNMHDQDAPCAVCRSPRQTTITVPGQTSCFPGWTMEYTGYLMTGHHTQKAATDYACVDADPEAVYHGEANMNGKLFYFAEVKCGSLPCQEYPEGRELACVVCSK